jgi:DNA-binding NarL/FixJ family response regulator
MNAMTVMEQRACSEALFLARADEYAQKRSASKPFCEELSLRERTILRMLGKGLTVEEITEVIGCTVNTTRSHVRSIYAKLRVRSSVQAVCMGREIGLLTE